MDYWKVQDLEISPRSSNEGSHTNSHYLNSTVPNTKTYGSGNRSTLSGTKTGLNSSVDSIMRHYSVCSSLQGDHWYKYCGKTIVIRVQKYSLTRCQPN